MDTIIVFLVNAFVAPLANAVPVMVSSGILFGVFAAAWAAFGISILRSQLSLDRAWERVGSLPVPARALAWLVFLPVLAGLWIWRRGWPFVARLALIAGVAGWNLLVFIPRPA